MFNREKTPWKLYKYMSKTKTCLLLLANLAASSLQVSSSLLKQKNFKGIFVAPEIRQW